MFNSLYGIVSEKQQDGICLDCNAIEWFIMMPAKEMEKLTLNEPARFSVLPEKTSAVYFWIC